MTGPVIGPNLQDKPAAAGLNDAIIRPALKMEHATRKKSP